MPSRRHQHSIDELFVEYGIDPVRLADEGRVEVQRLAAVDFALNCFLLACYDRGLLHERYYPIFLGGTVIKLVYLGKSGRASFDLDFNWLRPMRPRFWNALERGMTFGPFTFGLSEKNRRGRARSILVSSPLFPGGSASIKVDLVGYPRVTMPVLSRIKEVPFPDTYEQPMGLWLPTLDPLENVAGKLCRWYREPNGKDLHDVVNLEDVLDARLPELAEILTWISGTQEQTPLATQRAGAPPEFSNLSLRLGEPDAQGLSVYDREQMVFIPDLTLSEKRSRTDVWLNEMIAITDRVEEHLRSDPRLLSIATRGGGYEAHLYELDQELHERYGTVDNPYRRRLATPPT